MEGPDGRRKQGTAGVQGAYSGDCEHLITNPRWEVWIFLNKHGKSLKELSNNRIRCCTENGLERSHWACRWTWAGNNEITMPFTGWATAWTLVSFTEMEGLGGGALPGVLICLTGFLCSYVQVKGGEQSRASCTCGQLIFDQVAKEIQKHKLPFQQIVLGYIWKKWIISYILHHTHKFI